MNLVGGRPGLRLIGLSALFLLLYFDSALEMIEFIIPSVVLCSLPLLTSCGCEAGTETSLLGGRPRGRFVDFVGVDFLPLAVVVPVVAVVVPDVDLAWSEPPRRESRVGDWGSSRFVQFTQYQG